MSEAVSEVTDTAEREVVIDRVVSAPRDLVFEAWTDPKHVVNWWGPTGFTTTIHEMDVRPGGVWRFIMHGPDGTDYANRVNYIEVVRPERLVYTQDGDVENDPQQFHVTVTFTEQNGGTSVRIHSLFATAERRNYVVEHYGAIEGGRQTLERLDEYVSTM